MFIYWKIFILYNYNFYFRVTTLEKLGKLPTVFKKDGVVTAGSSSVSRNQT